MKNIDGRTLFGITLKSGHDIPDDIQTSFVLETDNDEEQLWKFKQGFENDFYDTGKPIRYHYYVSVYDPYYMDEDVNRLPILGLHMCPDVEFIGDNIKQNIMANYGISEEDIRFSDICDAAFFPTLCNQEIKITEKEWNLGGKWFDEILETLVAIIPHIDRLIGFYMDKAINRIGTTNWDALQELLGGESAINAAINRITEKER